MTETKSKNWYVVRAISGKEKKVKDLIELETRCSFPPRKYFRSGREKRLVKSATSSPDM
jgi:transcription antitermination factor NusG